MAHGFLIECKATGNISDLETAIFLLQSAARKFSDTDPRLKECQNCLATALLTQFRFVGGTDNVYKALALRARTVGLVIVLSGSSLTETVFDSVDDSPNDMMISALDILRGFHQAVDLATLENAITLYQEALSLQAPSHQKWICSMELTEALLMQFHCTGDMAQVDEAVTCMRQCTLMQQNLTFRLGTALLEQAQIEDRNRRRQYILEAAEVLQKASMSDQRAIQFMRTGQDLSQVFQQTKNTRDIDAAIGNLRQATLLLSSGHALQGSLLGELAQMLHNRYDETGNLNNLAEAIGIGRVALILHPASHPERSTSLNNLANAIIAQYHQKGDINDLEEVIELHREALALHSTSHPDCQLYLHNLATSIQFRYERKGDFKDLEEAVKLHREALALVPGPCPARGGSLNGLAGVLQTQYKQRGDFKDLEEAIELLREALTLLPVHQLDYRSSLNNLGFAVQTRYEQKGDITDLEEAITLMREVLAFWPAPNPNRGRSLNNLASAVALRYEKTSDFKDLQEAIQLYREALTLRPTGHPNRGGALRNLATAIHSRYEQKGNLKDLNEAIELHRGALALHPAPHLSRGDSLRSLASTLHTRFEQTGNFQDLEEAIELSREALVLRPTPHLERAMALNNLANLLKDQYKQTGIFTDLEEAITLHREALSLRPISHPDRSASLNNLALAVKNRYLKKGDFNDLEEMVELHRESLALVPTSSPVHGDALSNFAVAVRIRYEEKGDLKDLEEAIRSHKTVVSIWLPPHPDRGDALTDLAYLLAQNYMGTEGIADVNDDAFSLYQEASTYMFSSPLKRLHHTHTWAQQAAKHGHCSALPAYHATVDLLPQIAALHLDVVSRQKMLTTLQGVKLAGGAAACAIKQAEFNVAVEMLEASRSIFWTQALHLRTPLHHLEAADPQLALKLRQLAQQLELASFRDTSRTRGPDNQEKLIAVEAEGARCRQLNEDWEATVDQVRGLPGFKEFMRPKAIATLQQAAKSGPIVILTGTPENCSALVMTLSADVQHVPLPDLSLSQMYFYAELTQALSYPGFNINKFLRPRAVGQDAPEQSELVARLVAEREGEVNMSTDAVFRFLLGDLWKLIVKPVFKALKLGKSAHPSRLWWCPTGSFSFLPIHAAGIYSEDGTDCVSDYVISSYTPTITTLLDPPSHPAGPFKMTTVIQPYTEGYSSLPGCLDELKNIIDRVPGPWLTALGDKSQATVQTVLRHLRGSSIVHFACHGVQDLTHPLDSSLILSDGRLKVSEIMHGPETKTAEEIKRAMSLAFLSACETAKGDNITPDESIHLAATLLFVGFRSVVATMWTIQDEDGPKVADKFYEQLFKKCDPNANPPVLPDLTESAEALHYAVAELRKTPGISFRRWVPFVHYGL
ncbi:CHAT domain-containing protein [Mycena pura]|uniref:CHAT domain-containing protein n=1 Tax=Mycena pura TaxID=153505 RepID=A0AAD6YE94_9AGAR|nr:CHAT domain-containing protein [Mycena pura]